MSIVSLADKCIKCSPFRLEYRQAFTLPWLAVALHLCSGVSSW